MIILPDGHQNRFRKVLPVITGHTQPTITAAITTICMKTQIPSYYYPTPNTINNADDKPANKVQDRTRKYDELGTLVAKYCTAEAAEKILAVARWYLSQGDDRSMDEHISHVQEES